MRIRSAERAAHWRGVLERQGASGLSIAAFCRQESLSQPSFYAWRRRLQSPDAVKATNQESVSRRVASPSGFVPVRIESAPIGGALHIRWPDGVSLEVPAGADLATVSGVMRALRETASGGELRC